jgi:hypothetical protein
MCGEPGQGRLRLPEASGQTGSAGSVPNDIETH